MERQTPHWLVWPGQSTTLWLAPKQVHIDWSTATARLILQNASKLENFIKWRLRENRLTFTDYKNSVFFIYVLLPEKLSLHKNKKSSLKPGSSFQWEPDHVLKIFIDMIPIPNKLFSALNGRSQAKLTSFYNLPISLQCNDSLSNTTMETDKPMPNAGANFSLRCLKTGVLITTMWRCESKIKLFSAQIYRRMHRGGTFFFFHFIFKRWGDQMVSPFEAPP